MYIFSIPVHVLGTVRYSLGLARREATQAGGHGIQKHILWPPQGSTHLYDTIVVYDTMITFNILCHMTVSRLFMSHERMITQL